MTYSPRTSRTLPAGHFDRFYVRNTRGSARQGLRLILALLAIVALIALGVWINSGGAP